MPPLIELLPTTSTSSGATWTYTTAPPPQAHTNPLLPLDAPSGSRSSIGVGLGAGISTAKARKSRPTRTAATNALSSIDQQNYHSLVAEELGGGGGGAGGGDGGGAPGGKMKGKQKHGQKQTQIHPPAYSSRKEEKLLKQLLEYEKDNARDAAIPVPKSSSVKARSRTKPPTSTPTTRRILSSQKTLQNHLSDEEALLHQHHLTNPASTYPGSTHPAHLSAALRATRRDPPPPLDIDGGGDAHPGAGAGAYGVPLAWAAARADPPGRPRRWFCEICGWWGRYRCGKCGARYCDLECKGGHEETRCQRFWVQ